MIVCYKRFYQGSINPLMDSISHMVSIFPKWTRVARRHHLHTISLVAIEKQQYCCKRAMQYKKVSKVAHKGIFKSIGRIFITKFNPQKDKDKKPIEKRIGNCLRLWNWPKCNCAITLYGYHIFAIIPRCFG